MPLRIKTTPIIAINTGINFLILARLSIEIFELKNEIEVINGSVLIPKNNINNPPKNGSTIVEAPASPI